MASTTKIVVIVSILWQPHISTALSIRNVIVTRYDDTHHILSFDYIIWGDHFSFESSKNIRNEYSLYNVHIKCMIIFFYDSVISINVFQNKQARQFNHEESIQYEFHAFCEARCYLPYAWLQ